VIFHHIDGDLQLVNWSVGPTWGIHLHGGPSLHGIRLFDGGLGLSEPYFSLVR
jgi:hypothetical protein